jgi:hypothetical protein
VEERMRFVLRLKDGGSMASLCREFGISAERNLACVEGGHERLSHHVFRDEELGCV